MENGDIVKVRGDKEHPITKGMTCPRSRLMLDHLYHPERINTPLKRKGERGERTVGNGGLR
jgi:anaerobic selenocysteine-containing dehydrogenase